MLKLKLTVIGKMHNEFAKKWVEHYQKLLGKHCELELKFIKEEKLNEGKNEAEVLFSIPRADAFDLKTSPNSWRTITPARM